MSSTPVPGSTVRPAPGPAEAAGRRVRRALAVTGAMTAALALWTVVGPVAGLGPEVRMEGEVRPVGAGSVIAASLLAGLAGWALLAVLERLTRRPGRIWTPIALVVLVLSLLGPAGPAAGTTDLTVLLGLHLVVAAVLIPGLGRTARG